jgi:hypothetical protein
MEREADHHVATLLDSMVKNAITIQIQYPKGAFLGGKAMIFVCTKVFTQEAWQLLDNDGNYNCGLTMLK